MAWTAEQMAQKRAKLQKKNNAAAGGAEPLSQRKSADSPLNRATTTAASGGLREELLGPRPAGYERSEVDAGSRNPVALGSTKNSVSDNKSNTWTAEKMAEKRAALQTQKQQTGTDLYFTALEDYRTRNNLGFEDAMDSRSDGLNRQKVTVSPAEDTLGTWYGQQAQKLKNSYAEYSQPDDFDKANQWFDQPRNQELVNKLLEKKSNYTSYAEIGTSRNGASAGDGSIDPFRTAGTKGRAGNTYSTADLKKLGYTDTEIRQAREYLDTMEEIPEWKQLARRTANTVGGVVDTVAAAPLMAGEYLVQVKKNSDALEALKDNDHNKRLVEAIQRVDGTNGAYTDEDLVKAGWNREEVAAMRARMQAAKQGIDTEKSVGYQLWNRGQQLMGAAQSGLTDVQRTVQGVATSAAENLAVAAINPAAVLPVLSAQGAADAMGQSAAKGESAGKALAGGVAKFGAGWAINSVGAADLARTMGADYARNSVAGAVADKIRALAGDSAFAAAHPAVANAISGGIDNAMQAFVETYADKAIDAALGDSEAAQTMFTTDTLVQALEAGLTGGASGALGGAVGTGLSKMNAGDSSLRGNVERYAAQDEYEQALKDYQRREELAQEPGEVDGKGPLSHALRDSSPNRATTTTAASGGNREEVLGQRPAGHEGNALPEGDAGSRNPLAKLTLQAKTETAANQAAEGNSAETAAISDNLAVQTFAEAAAGDSLTGKTIRLFTPEAGNEANRAAFEEAYGVKLPSTAAATRRMLREVAAQRSQQNAVENAGESVGSSTETAADGAEPLSQRISDDSPPSMGALDRTGTVELTEQNGADRQAVMQSVPVEESTLDGMDSSNSPMRETYGMEAPRTEGQKQARTEQVLRSWKVGEKAAQEISRKQPEGVDSDRYAAAASTLYRLGQMEDVKNFDQALELAGTGSGMAANVNYVLGNLKGRNALEIAYTYGKDAAETRWAESQLGGNLTEKSLAGRGETIYKGTLRNANDAGSQVIELNAAATGTTAVMKNVLQNGAGQADSRVRAYVDTETARIFFGDSAQDTFGTVLHEDYHWYNALDSKGAKALQDHALLYLARSSGFETVDEMIREKMTDYAQQNLTYEEAAEELVGDAWRGIFSTEADFKRWVEFQRRQAEKNSGRAGTIRTVMNRVKEMLGGIISRAKEVLALDPDNRAALKAQRLAENERKILQDEYFAHAQQAMDNLRSAKENAAALKTESAAEGRSMRFQLQEEEETLEKQLNRNLGRLEQMTPADEITGKEIEYGATSKENAENIVRFFESIGGKVERDGFGVVELTRKGAKATVQHGNGPVKQIAAAAIPNVIRYGEQIGFVENWKGRGYNTHTFVAPVVVNGIKIYEAVIVNEYRSTKQGNKFYVHEVCGSDGSLLVLDDAGQIKQKQESADTVLKTEEGGERPSFPAKNSIAQENAESKGNSEPVKKSVLSAAEGRGIRYSLPDMASETEAKKTERQETLTIRPAQVNPERTARVSETDWSGQKTQDVYKAIRTILNEFGITAKTFRMEDVDIEFSYGSNNIQESANKQSILTKDEYNDFALVQANIEEVLANAVPLEAHADKKGKPHVDGMIVLASALQDGERIVPVRAELKLYDNRPTALYMAIAETTAEESRNAANKKRTGSQAYDDAISHTMEMPTGSFENPDRKVRQEPLLTQEAAFPVSSDLTITDFYDLVKHDANFTKYFSDEVAYKAERLGELKEKSRDLEKQRRNLKTERTDWMDSAEVKELEAKKKSLGLFSAEAKAFKASEEYQAYLAKRKDFNQRSTELDDKIGEMNDALREANARLDARRNAQKKDLQFAYDAKAKEAGGAAKYRRLPDTLALCSGAAWCWRRFCRWERLLSAQVSSGWQAGFIPHWALRCRCCGAGRRWR